jgi:hypothetical protein
VIIVIMGEAAVFGSETTAWGHVGLTADDRFDPRLFGFAVEFNGSKHVPMVGHGHRRLAKGFDLLDKRLDLIRTIEQTELGMEMKMDERRGHGGILGGQGRGSQTTE